MRDDAAQEIRKTRMREEQAAEEANAETSEVYEEFDKFDQENLSNMSNKELAKFQAGYLPEDAQFIIAQHEWNRRLMKEQVSAMRFCAVIGLLGVALGAFVAWWMTAYDSRQLIQLILEERAQEAPPKQTVTTDDENEPKADPPNSPNTHSPPHMVDPSASTPPPPTI